MKVLLSLCACVLLIMCADNEPNSNETIEAMVIDSRFQDDEFNVSFISNDREASFQCLVELTGGQTVTTTAAAAGSWSACTSPMSVPMVSGQQLKLRIRAVSARGTSEPVLISRTHPGGTGGVSTPATHVARIPKLQIGSSFSFTIPRGMHVTQYATSNTYHGSGLVEFVHLQHGQNYNYTGSMVLANLGNGCGATAQDVVTLDSNSGGSYRYCRSSLATQDYMSLLRGTYARNHVEVASNDLFTMQESLRPMPRLLVQVFGPNESKLINSRFNELCSPSRRFGVVRPFNDITMMRGFWHSEYIKVKNTYVCTTSLGGINGGLYKVAGFDAVVSVNKTRTTDYGKYLSVVYMERTHGENGIDEYFARNFQSTLINSLRKNRP